MSDRTSVADLYRTEYGIQPYVVDRRQIRAEEVRPAKDKAHALRMAERLAQIRAGAVAFSRRVSPELGEYEEPVILGRWGRTPDGDDLGRA